MRQVEIKSLPRRCIYVMKIHTYEHNWFSLSNLSAMMRCDWSRVHLTAQQCPLAPPVHCVTSNIRFDSVTIRILHFYGQLMRWNVPYQKWCARDQDICDRTARTWRHELRIHAAMGRIGVPWRNCRQFAVHLPLNLSQQMRFCDEHHPFLPINTRRHQTPGERVP